MSDSESGKKKKRGGWILLCVIAVVVCAAATFPRIWGPGLVHTVIQSALPSGGPYTNRFEVVSVGFTEAVIRNGDMGAIPGRPSFVHASVKYTIPGLISRRVDSVSLSGFSFDPDYKVENFSMGSGKHAGPLEVPEDPLCGWSVKSAVFKTGDIDFSSLIPEGLPLLSRKADLFLDVKLENGTYRVNGEGNLCGNRVVCLATYDVARRGGNLSAKVFPRLKLSDPEITGPVEVTGMYAIASTNGYSVSASAECTALKTGFKVYAGIEASQAGTSVVFSQPEFSFSEKDPFVALSLEMAPIPANVRGIYAGAKVSSSGRVDIVPGVEPKWEFSASVSGVSAGAEVNGFPVSLTGGRIPKISASGTGAHFDFAPFSVIYSNAVARGLIFDRGFARFMVDEKRLMISEANLGFSGGSLRLYALYFNLEKLSTGFTVFIDKLDLGRLFAMLPEAGGRATGYVYGRIPLRVRSNGELRLDNAFLYSPPGDTGNISLEDTGFIKDYSMSIGIPESESAGLAAAFQNLDYSVFRVDLLQPRDDNGQIRVLLKGETPQGRKKVPVNLDLKFNAPVQKLLNYGINPGSLVK